MLTKSNYLLGLQCPKLLWIKKNKKELLPEIDKHQQHIFNVGNKVGQLAKTLYPKGIDIPEYPIKNNLELTKKHINTNKILFEPSFQTTQLYSRADILIPKGKKYDIIEVKSSTKVKDVNIHDISFQRHVYELAGIKIRKCYVMHINSAYIKKGPLSSKKLFTLEDVTKEVDNVSEGIEDRIEQMLQIIKGKQPKVDISDNCKKPYPCPLQDQCWDLPLNNVFNLYRGGKKSFAMFKDGVINLKNIPDIYNINTKQQIQRKCAKTGEVHLDKEGIKQFLDKLQYPLYFLDFETYQIAIPMFKNHKPYQQIPFQFSLHIQDAPDGKLKHEYYLAKGKKDPRKPFLNALKRKLGSEGSIVVYNQAFEKMILRQLGEAYPAEQKWVEEINERVVDLLVPFRNFDYYNSKQQGSCSIKKVLPAIVGNKGYEGLEIGQGMDASLEYLYITHEKADVDVVKKVRRALLKYCKLDTMAEVWILEKLRGFVK